MHLSYNVQLIIPLAFFENGLISLGVPVFLNAAPFEIIAGLFLRVSTSAKLGVGVCGGLVTPLALLEKGFTLLPEESVILLDGTPLRWIGGVFVTKKFEEKMKYVQLSKTLCNHLYTGRVFSKY